MCVIIVDPQGKEMDLQILRNAVDRNPDGYGMAVLDGDNIITHHGFGYRSAKRNWIKYKDMPRVFHARVRTCGKTDIANTHPFDTSRNGEPRYLFHNGQVSMPRFNEDMSDSWHFAQYLRNFDTNEELYRKLDAYALRENSRFTFLTPGKIHISGKGWFHRDGISFSAVSALADVREDTAAFGAVKKYVYVGGFLESDVEVTSDTSYSGLHYDTERKLYSNKVPAPKPIATHYDLQKHFIDKNGTKRWLYDRNGKDCFWDVDAKKDCIYDPKIHGEIVSGSSSYLVNPTKGIAKEAKPKTGLDTMWAELRKEGILTLCRAPWLRSNYGAVAPSQRSYPNAEDANFEFDYGDIGSKNGYGNLVTYRVNSGATDLWYEVVFKNGVHIERKPVDGPYPNGLLIKNNSDTVTYGRSTMTMDAWREIIITVYFPEMLNDEDDEELIINRSSEHEHLEELAVNMKNPRLKVTLKSGAIGHVELDGTVTIDGE